MATTVVSRAESARRSGFRPVPSFGSKARFVCGRGRALRLVADGVERDCRLRRPRRLVEERVVRLGDRCRQEPSRLHETVNPKREVVRCVSRSFAGWFPPSSCSRRSVCSSPPDGNRRPRAGRPGLITVTLDDSDRTRAVPAMPRQTRQRRTGATTCRLERALVSGSGTVGRLGGVASSGGG